MDHESLKVLQEALGDYGDVSTDKLRELEEEDDIRYVEVITPFLPNLVLNRLKWAGLIAMEKDEPKTYSNKPSLKFVREAELTEEYSAIYFEDINSAAPKLD